MVACLLRGLKWSARAGGTCCGALAATAVGQAVYLRWSYVPPVDPPGKAEGSAGRSLQGRPLRVLFVGDSVCVGVGGSIAGSLQTGFGERLARLRNAPVVWRTVAASGADTAALRALVQKEVPEGESYDLAVLLCGVNDGKKIFEGKWPDVFRRDLAMLCSEIRRKVPEGIISVPRIPGYESAPQLQAWPMKYFIHLLFNPYDAQKQVVASSQDGVESPTPPQSELPLPTDLHLWASDGMHPSEEGYRIVGAWIAETFAE